MGDTDIRAHTPVNWLLENEETAQLTAVEWIYTAHQSQPVCPFCPCLYSWWFGTSGEYATHLHTKEGAWWFTRLLGNLSWASGDKNGTSDEGAGQAKIAYADGQMTCCVQLVWLIAVRDDSSVRKQVGVSGYRWVRTLIAWQPKFDPWDTHSEKRREWIVQIVLCPPHVCCIICLSTHNAYIHTYIHKWINI